MEFIAVIMAGGKGQRFWPLSTEEKPKQFLDLEACGRTLLQQTFDRLLPVSQTAGIFVATSARYVNLVRTQLPELPPAQILIEPEGRDSAPAIALASIEIERRFGNVITGFFPSDHRIGDIPAFQQTLRDAIQLTQESKGIVTLGIRPSYPATGFGYIETADRYGLGYRVNRFTEKPERELAQRFLDNSNYYWNAGMFMWHSQTILQELARHAPELFYPLRAAVDANTVAEVYPSLPKISIDYAVMEKTDQAFVIPSLFAWDDVGDWSALERLLKTQRSDNNTMVGQHIAFKASNNLMVADQGDTLVTLGVDNVILVKQGNTVLLASKDHLQDIKQLLGQGHLDQQRLAL